MAHYDLKTEQLKEMAPKLRAGDTVTLTGTVYTARDAAHKKIVAAMDAGDKLPLDLAGAAIYYAGPTPAKPGQVIGSVGPTTSGRMDPFAPRLLDAGLACMIGKGVRGQGVQDAMARNGAVYMVAIGGALRMSRSSRMTSWAVNRSSVSPWRISPPSSRRIRSAATSTPRALQSIRRIEPKGGRLSAFFFLHLMWFCLLRRAREATLECLALRYRSNPMLFRSIPDQNIVFPKGFNAPPRNNAVIFGEQPDNAALRGHNECGNLSADRIEQQIAHLTHPCSVAQIDHLTAVQFGKSHGILHLILS